MEDAYRTLPCTVEDLPVNVAAIRHPETKQWTFLQMWALLFGFESAVLQFGRWSKFCEGAGRRLLSLLWSLHVDDGHLCDLQATRGEVQALVNELFCCLGTPLAEAKRQKMAQCNVCLGAVHDVGAFHTKAVVDFWPKEQLIVKL